MRGLDTRLTNNGGAGTGVSELVDFAVIMFLENFRVCFIGETTSGR